MLHRVALVRTDVSEERSAFIRSVRRLLVTANAVPSSPILVTLIMEAIRSSETLVLTRATRRNVPEDGILHSYYRENLQLLFVVNTGITNLSALEGQCLSFYTKQISGTDCEHQQQISLCRMYTRCCHIVLDKLIYCKSWKWCCNNGRKDWSLVIFFDKIMLVLDLRRMMKNTTAM
jgi:hypothetical protein